MTGLTVLLGGVRSGKSRLAVDLADRAAQAAPGGPPVTFVATCPRLPGDHELDARIEAHQAERPGHWATVEAEHDLAAAIAGIDREAPVVVDCLTLWVGNLQHRGDDAEAIVRASAEAIGAVAARSGLTVVVSNEVGHGIVPADALSRAYRDLLGGVNQQWVRAADRALLLVAGRALPLHDPVDLLG